MKRLTAVAAMVMASSDALTIHHRPRRGAASPTTICHYANNNNMDAARPRRAVAHITASRHEEASRAGYIVRSYGEDDIRMAVEEEVGANKFGGSNSNNEKRRRPLRVIRRIVLRRGNDGRNNDDDVKDHHQQLDDCDELTEEVLVRVLDTPNLNQRIDGSKNKRRLFQSSSSSHTPNRVTFKSTRRAVHSLSSSPTLASLTEYMMQPVEQYSLLSFHDHCQEDDSSSDDNNHNTSTHSSSVQARRWLVRRLTPAEASEYTVKQEGRRSRNVDNLFRLAVPLKPLIGWDLTPVIDLEVLPPTINNCGGTVPSLTLSNEDSINSNGCQAVDENQTQQKQQQQWAPLKTIRNRVIPKHPSSYESKNTNDNNLPVVKIRSLRVSLLSNRDEVHAAMTASSHLSNNDKKSTKRKDQKRGNNAASSNNNKRSNSSSSYQKDAIEMVTRVEEALRPHITFEAELSWNEQDNISTSSSDGNNTKQHNSTVMAKATAVTSLTIPKIPSGILRAAVPSSFLVQRLGSTLTSKALEVCLPRFLRQLERDYRRWSGQ